MKNKKNVQLYDKFVSVPYRALQMNGLSLADAVVYGYLNGFARDLGSTRAVWESTRSIANKLGLSATTVSDSIGQLEKAGLLQTVRRKGKPNVYDILHDLKDPDDKFGLEQSDEREETDEYPDVPSYVKDICRSWDAAKMEPASSTPAVIAPQAQQTYTPCDTNTENTHVAQNCEAACPEEKPVSNATVWQIYKYICLHCKHATKVNREALLGAFSFPRKDIIDALEYLCEKRILAAYNRVDGIIYVVLRDLWKENGKECPFHFEVAAFTPVR